jgi:hypothetical protein
MNWIILRLAKRLRDDYLGPVSFGVQHPHQINSVPDTPDWLHEIKYDGYRLRLERDGDVCA